MLANILTLNMTIQIEIFLFNLHRYSNYISNLIMCLPFKYISRSLIENIVISVI